jgi:hypothetical protein
MALKIYLDAACTIECTPVNPDTLRSSARLGQTATVQGSIWIKSDNALLTYEDITLTADGDDANADVEYAPDNAGAPGAWAQTIIPSNGAYAEAVRIWRRVTCPNVQGPFNRINISHELTWSEFLL